VDAPKVDEAHLADEVRMKLPERQRHARAFL
jgi:hypothetical protein